MSGYIAEALDLTRLPPVQLVTVDYEAERSALIAGTKARLIAAGIGYDVESLESDPIVYLLEEVAYRKTVDLAALNAAGLKLMLPTAPGSFLDQIAATYYADLRLARLQVGTDLLGNPIMESDARFALRISLAPQARTPGTLGGYEFWAMTAAPLLIDALALNYASGVAGISPGQITVVVYAEASLQAAQKALAQAMLLDRNIKLGSDEVSVVDVVRVPAHVEAIQYVRPGPSPALVEAAGATALASYLSDNRKIGAVLTRNNIASALTVGGVKDIGLISPATNIDPSLIGVVELDRPDISAQVIGV